MEIGIIPLRIHLNQQVDMIAHNRKTQHIHKIDVAKVLDNAYKFILFNILERKSIQRCSGHDMIYRFLIREYHSCDSRHFSPQLSFIQIVSAPFQLSISRGLYQRPCQYIICLSPIFSLFRKHRQCQGRGAQPSVHLAP